MHRVQARLVDRRQWLAGAAQAASLALAAKVGGSFAAELAASPPPVKSQPDVVIYRGSYPGWPWVARAGQGHLVCVFREDSVHDFSPTGRVLLSESRDDGATWSPPRVVVDTPGVDDRNAAIICLPDGRWMVCYNTYTSGRVSRPMVLVSSDRGATWPAARPLADLDARTRSAPVALSTGDILIPFYRAPGNGALAARSSDGGKTWQVVPVPDVPGFLGDEWSVAEVAKGRLVGILRNSGSGDGYFWKTESRNGGQKWDRPQRTNVRDARATSPAHLDMHGQVPVLTYADRRMVSVSMVTSRDPDFRRWDLASRICCYQYRPDGQPIADASYPVSVAVGPRRRLVVDYEIRAEAKQIAGYYVDLPAAWEK